MRKNNPILSSALIVFSFWWCFFTLRDFSMSPLEVIRNWAYIGYSMRLWVIGLVAGIGAGAWYIWFKRTKVEEALKGVKARGMVSTLGAVPSPSAAPTRAPSTKTRLPLTRPPLVAWMNRAKEEHPEHLALFLAIWDIYSAHREWPASHRINGHANRRLWEHCLAVTEKAFSMAPTWKFTGVHVKVRGRRPKLIIAPGRADFEFNPKDPLIPILALAHDIGKLEAYSLNTDGSVSTREHGSTKDHDDVGVMHDSLGARILARLPEFWALPSTDRRILNLVIAHYHHPSDFPVGRDGLSQDDRMTSLLEFLIQADRSTGMDESGLTQADEDSEITEDESKDLYAAFVELVTEHGRINGIHGSSQADKGFMIGSKHDGLIVVRERDLRNLLLAKLGLSIEIGDARFRITRNLLRLLSEKGLLYERHNGTDFSRYSPLWEVSHRNSKTGGFICKWDTTLIFKPLPAHCELDILVSLPEKKARLRIERAVATHDSNLKNNKYFLALQKRAFPDLSDTAAAATVADDEDADLPAPAPSAPVSAPVSVSVSVSAAAQPPAAPAPMPAAAPAPAPAPTPGPTPPAAPAPADASSSIVKPARAPRPGAADSTSPPWDEPETTLAPEGAPVALADADLPDISLDAGAVEVDGEFTQSNEPASEDCDALFEGFDAAQPPAPPTPPTPELGLSPRDIQMLASLRGGAETGEQPVAAVGRAVRDEDTPRVRDFGRSKRDKDALKALREAPSADALAPKAKRRGKGPNVTVELLQQMISAGQIPVAGVHEGQNMVLRSDLERALPQPGVFQLIKDELKLPIHAAGNAQSFVAVPVAPVSTTA